MVSLCDVDRRMAAAAVEIVLSRQAWKKKPRIYKDYRKLLARKDIDIALIATPDHWPALPMIEAVKSGVDVYVQKPISVDIVEGQAMLAAARKYGRVGQVGTQRHNTPHIILVRDLVLRQGLLGRIGLVEIYCYYHMRSTQDPPDSALPEYLDWDFWNGPAPMRPYNRLAHPRRWRGFMEYCDGVIRDMCIHMLDMVRWKVGVGWPKRVSSAGGILFQKNAKLNITDTQTATFEFDEFPVV